MQPGISLTMIVKNEAGTLARGLASVAGLVDEVVVVDTGSTDTSLQVAQGFGARVAEFRWNDSFAEARNASLELATREWAFWLDGDEWMDDENRGRFHAIAGRLAAADAVFLMEQASPLSKAGSSTLCVSQARLFRNTPDARWRYRVHEQILPACLARGAAPMPTDVVIFHSGYESPGVKRQKELRNLRLLEIEHAENPDDTWVLFQLGRIDLAERFAEGERLLLNALERCGPADPLRRQIFAALARGYRLHGQTRRAGDILERGLASFPNDTGLLYEAGTLAHECGDLDQAGRRFAALLSRRADPDEYLGAVDRSWRGWQARYNLAAVLFRQGRLDEAESHWNTALVDNPVAAHLWLGLAEIRLARSDWTEFERAVAMVERCAVDSDEVTRADILLLRARAHLARSEFPKARALLGETLETAPGSVPARLLLARAWVLEGRNLDEAESALSEVLVIDPANAEARRCLDALAASDADDPGYEADADSSTAPEPGTAGPMPS